MRGSENTINKSHKLETSRWNEYPFRRRASRHIFLIMTIGAKDTLCP